ncbi:putative urea ABC transporter substrate-binding protein [Variovorax sp. J22R115]|uniref:putative urea ABC transporter substrate-binding protein n=1 Tax=Variovorax sp. J22R115 TaxID=3053509 RepID=UPI00257555E6|nr:putative urea ABC transporter substrate-binding protein [Variovorax sp. J22R115]MDM0047395.1 putative urea ABC transporter substrate-binding protein [Variovorax sp. J22R115]
MSNTFSRLLGTATLCIAALAGVHSADAAPRTSFKVCSSVYAGFMPWAEAQSQGILAKWGKKYGVSIEVVQLNDYVESINQYTAGKFDGCAMANMDALTIPAAGGVDSTAMIVADYSDGNDGIVIKGKNKKLADLKGQTVNLVEFSVSHYFLARALESAAMSERDVKVINTSDADIVAAFATPSVKNVVTWNPMLAQLGDSNSVTQVYSSRQLPGELMDMMVVNTKTLNENPNFGKALTGAWFEMMAVMSAKDESATKSLNAMAKASGTDLAGFKSQLATTALFYTPKAALDFATSPDMPKFMTRVANFSFDHGILGQGVKSADAIGMAFDGGLVVGNKNNVKLRFDQTYVRMAAEGRL